MTHVTQDHKKLTDELYQQMSDLQSENSYLKSGIEFWKKKSDEYELWYHRTDEQLQELIRENTHE